MRKKTEKIMTFDDYLAEERKLKKRAKKLNEIMRQSGLSLMFIIGTRVIKKKK